MAGRKLCRALDFDVGLHPDLHARVVAHRRRDELVAGDLHHFSRQPHRRHPDDPERARRDALRNPLPRFLPRLVRHARGEYSRAHARIRRLRLVRNSNLDRRQRHLQDHVDLCSVVRPKFIERVWNYAAAVHLLSLFLGHQHARGLQRHRLHPLAAQHQSAAAHRARIAFAWVGLPKRRRLRPDSFATVRLRSRTTEVRPVLSPSSFPRSPA